MFSCGKGDDNEEMKYEAIAYVSFILDLKQRLEMKRFFSSSFASNLWSFLQPRCLCVIMFFPHWIMFILPRCSFSSWLQLYLQLSVLSYFIFCPIFTIIKYFFYSFKVYKNSQIEFNPNTTELFDITIILGWDEIMPPTPLSVSRLICTFLGWNRINNIIWTFIHSKIHTQYLFAFLQSA